MASEPTEPDHIQPDQHTQSPVPGHDGQRKRNNSLIYAYDDEPQEIDQLAEQTGYYGYEMKKFFSLDELADEAQKKNPTAVLIHLESLEKDTDYTAPLRLVHEAAGENVPLLFFSEDEDFETHLKVVRLGGKRLFIKPVNVSALIETLDELTFRDTAVSEPYRVLIVDDSPMQATFESAHLRRIGVITKTLNDPDTILRTLAEFSPDLVILDMYMPRTNGLEVAGVIRQIESFVSIPIVFLSSETDREIQLEAMSLGGDDFLTKPIKPEHLISAVLSRAGRYRQLRSLMYRDSLTRLLNNNAINDRLHQEIVRARRKNEALSYAILDIDHFKKVNDSYGHAAGDFVLKNLANLLRQRLRRSDIIGRLGGEEFSIIFPDTHLEEAGRVMDELAGRFSSIQQRTGEEVFTTSFSCGVAGFPEYLNPVNLSNAADQALYQAKNTGRNRVVLSAGNGDR